MITQIMVHSIVKCDADRSHMIEHVLDEFRKILKDEQCQFVSYTTDEPFQAEFCSRQTITVTWSGKSEKILKNYDAWHTYLPICKLTGGEE